MLTQEMDSKSCP